MQAIVGGMIAGFGARLAMESDEHGTKMTLVAPMHVAEGKEAGA